MSGALFSGSGRFAAVMALMSIVVYGQAFGQPASRVTRTDADLDRLNRIQYDDGALDGRERGSNSLLDRPSEIDVSKVDQKALAALMKEAVQAATQLYTSLEADRNRYPQLRTALQELLQLRAQAARLNEDLADRVPLKSILVSFRALDKDWRNLSHQLAQTPRLSEASLRNVERLDRIDREVGKLFQVEPQLDRRALLLQLSTLESSFRNLVDELRQSDRGDANRIAQMVYDARKAQSQASRVEEVVVGNGEYERIVREYGRFSRMWEVLLDQLRSVDDRYVERQVRYVVDADNAVQQLLWLEHTSDREQLKQTAMALMRSVDEFYNRTPLKLLLNVKNLAEAMQTANDFYGTVQNFKDMIDRDQSQTDLLDSYQYVEEYGYTFTRTFERMNSQAARVVLQEIEAGIASLRSELNMTGSVSEVDYRELLPTAASLENLADHLDVEVRGWLNADRQPFRDEALQASRKFMTRTKRLNQMLQLQPSLQELRRETAALMEEWSGIYQHLSKCRTSDRASLAELAREIRSDIYDLTAPLEL